MTSLVSAHTHKRYVFKEPEEPSAFSPTQRAQTSQFLTSCHSLTLRAGAAPLGGLIGKRRRHDTAGGHGSAVRRARLCLRAPAQHLLHTSSASALRCGGGRSSCTWPSLGLSSWCVHKGPWKLPSAGGAPWLPLPRAFAEQR